MERRRAGQPIKIGLIGLGFAGTILHLPSLAKNPRVELIAVSDIDKDKLSEFSANQSHLKAAATDDYEAIIANKEIEAVFIASPTATHAEIAIKALKAGKHVFCEKPISIDLEDGGRMVAEGESRPQQILMIGQVLRFWPEYVEIKKIIDAGVIGKPVIARTYRANPMPKSVFYEKDELSGGVIVDLGLHDIDFLSWALGEVESIFAQGGNLSGRGDVIDYAQIHFNFESGAIAYLESNWALPENFPFSMAVEITGTGGMVSADNTNANTSLEVTVGGDKRTSSVVTDFNGYHFEQDAFLNAIQCGGPSPMPARDALCSLALALAAKESIGSGKEVQAPKRRGMAFVS